MLPSLQLLRASLWRVIDDKAAQGHVVAGLPERLDALPNSYDALAAFANELAHLPLRPDWPYVEPSDLEEIWAECDAARPLGPLADIDLADSARRVEAAFLGSVCGCILGKPLEARLSLAEIRAALEALGEWPLATYVSERIAQPLGGRLHRSWPETVRERITYVAADDDINYTILGMLNLERAGLHFSQHDVRDLWLLQVPIAYTFGPERTTLVKAGLDYLEGGGDATLAAWPEVLNPGDELCGAMIRADAYGYACPGRPALAAELAWRDASLTHRRTGIYGTMFAAAAIATAQVAPEPLDIFETALKFIPRRSRFYQRAADALREVRQASDWLDGYARVHARYAEYGHCRIFQETGTLMNTLRFAESVGDGICKQVMQGNDTDSYGATAGSILGAYFGPGHLDERWLHPFRDDLHTALARFYERSLAAVARRMGELPARIQAELQRPPDQPTGAPPGASASPLW